MLQAIGVVFFATWCTSFYFHFQAGKLNEEYAAPPSASELPPPELFTQMHPQEQMAAQVSPPDNCNQVIILTNAK